MQATQGKRFIEVLGQVSKSMQQAQGRVLDAELTGFRRLGRWPSRDELHIALTHAAVMQWKMERVQYHAERHFIQMNATAF